MKSAYGGEAVLFEADGPLGKVTIHRPKALNALNMDVLRGLDELVSDVQENGGFSVLSLEGSGEKAFVAGADIAQMASFSPTDAEAFAAYGQRVFERWESLDAITVAKVDGFALGGGCELAMCCDLIYANVKAKFGQPEVNLGVIPGFGGTQRLQQRVGLSAARELILTGKMISADEAKALGLLNAVFAVDAFEAETAALVAGLIEKSPATLRSAKRVLRYPSCEEVVTGSLIERQVFGLCFAHPDQKEGMQAFLDKREARFLDPKATGGKDK